METITLQVFPFDELNEEAKERVLKLYKVKKSNLTDHESDDYLAFEILRHFFQFFSDGTVYEGAR